MVDEGDGRTHAGFLAPEPAGPEPDLTGQRPEVPAVRAVPGTPGFAPPAEHEAHAPAEQAYPPVSQQLGWGAPAPGAPRPSGQAPRPLVPGNGAAVAGLSLSISAGVVLLLSLGTSSIVSIVCAALGIRYSRQGRARVDRGETPKHRDLAQAGFVTGIVALALSILCTIAWLLVAILYATDEGFREDLKDQLDDGRGDSPGGLQTSLQLGLLAVRLLASIIR